MLVAGTVHTNSGIADVIATANATNTAATNAFNGALVNGATSLIPMAFGAPPTGLIRGNPGAAPPQIPPYGSPNSVYV